MVDGPRWAESTSTSVRMPVSTFVWMPVSTFVRMPVSTFVRMPVSMSMSTCASLSTSVFASLRDPGGGAGGGGAMARATNGVGFLRCRAGQRPGGAGARFFVAHVGRRPFEGTRAPAVGAFANGRRTSRQ